ncbi:MAG TPA: GNAT family N-acetyltransferase [Thermomicrobiales bacterium]|nr:GNAT family N-acetyltransferase [Thermomicrobiales bacterium]
MGEQPEREGVSDDEIRARFRRTLARLVERNAAYSDEGVAADVAAAVEEVAREMAAGVQHQARAADATAAARGLRVREATAADYQAVRGVLAEVAAMHLSALPRLARADDDVLARDENVFAGRSFAQCIEDPDTLLLAAEVDGEMRGALLAMLRRQPGAPPLVARCYLDVASLAVREEHRRAGVGRALMAAANRWAREHGATEVDLDVWEFNPGALAFYEGLGYETVRRRMWRSLER